MKKTVYQILLPVMFLFRIMFPIGNAAYLMCILATGKDSLWLAVFVASLILEIGTMLIMAKGDQSLKARRYGAYGIFGLSMVHLCAFWVLYMVMPGGRQALNLLYMSLLTAGYALMMYLASVILSSATEQPETSVEA